MKYLKIFFIAICILIFGIGSFYLGVNYESMQKQKEENYITQNMIAVVNTDEGILVDGNKKNYAADLMSFPDVNFTTTGLVDARDGVENGRYAAYIIIPNNFSRAINSINGKPERTSITYAVADNLRKDIREDVLQDIHDYIDGLSTNVSYVYVASIMDEFHEAQDGAGTVLKNDMDELKEVSEIDYEALVPPFLFPEVKREEWKVEAIDFTGHYKKLDETVNKIGSNYEGYLTEGRLAFEKLSEKRDVVSTSISNLTDTMNSIDIEYQYIDSEESVSENQLVYADGLNHLKEFDEDRMQQLSVTKNGLEEIVCGRNPYTSLAAVESSISDNKQDIDRIIRNIKSNQLGRTDVSVSWNSIGNRNQNDFWEDYMIVKRSSFEAMETKVESLDDTEDILSTIRDQLSGKIDEIDVDTERRVQNIITNEIVRPIEDNINAETARLQDEERQAEEKIKLFLQEMEDYDPLEYVDEEEIDEELLKAQEGIGEMEDAIEENNLTYFEFVTDVYDTADENYDALREKVETHNEEAISNIDTTIEKTKTSRQEKNQINSALLNDFTQKLSFTRLGTLENQTVNEFIVSPLQTEGVSEVQNLNKLSEEEKKSEEWVIATIAVLAAIILISRIFTYILQKKERGEMYETGL